jgi:FkbM family methyltransferase
MTIKTVKLESGNKLDLDEYGWPGESCFWFHMDHKYDGDGTSPDFKAMFEGYIKKQYWELWIHPGMTCIDIGGHSGDTAIPMMARCRSTVLTVEPNPVIIPYLELNCAVNQHLGKFVIATEAVSSQSSDSLVFGDHQNGMCNGGILSDTWDDETARKIAGMTGETITISGMTLEDMCNKYLTPEDIDNIGFVKIDTEGHEIEIIRSSKDFLAKHKPILFTEWFFAYSDKDTAELFRVIDEAGYVAHYPETMQPADPGLRANDLICIHKDRL